MTDRECICNECGALAWEGNVSPLDVCDLEALDAGSEVPAGRCADPECGALCYLVDTESDVGRLRNVLQEFTSSINATGGVVELDSGLHVLTCDEEWIDLAEVYIRACDLLKEEPKVVMK